MRIQTLNTWLQVFASIGVIIGLFVVAYELRQTKTLSQAQLMDQTYTDLRSGFQNLMGETPATSIARACLDPDNLTPEDVVVLSAYLSEQHVQIIRWYMLDNIGSFGIDWRVAGTDPFRTILATAFGRAWFNRAKEFWPAEIAAQGEALLAGQAAALWNCETVFEQTSQREQP